MNMLVKLSSALSADSDLGANPAAMVQHSNRSAQPRYIAERRERRRGRLSRR